MMQIEVTHDVFALADVLMVTLRDGRVIAGHGADDDIGAGRGVHRP